MARDYAEMSFMASSSNCLTHQSQKAPVFSMKMAKESGLVTGRIPEFLLPTVIKRLCCTHACGATLRWITRLVGLLYRMAIIWSSVNFSS